MKKIFFIILLIFVFIGCSSKKENAEKKALEQGIKDGINHIVQKENAKAYGVFYKLTKEFPDNKEVHYYLGLINIDLRKFDEAMINFTTVLELDPDYNLGERYEVMYINYLNNKKLDYKGVEKEVYKFYQLYPKNPANAKFLLMIGDGYRDNAKFNEALKAYRNLVDSFPENNTYRISAEEMIKFIEQNSDYNREPLALFANAKKQHTPEDAVTIFREIITKFPKANIVPLVKLEIALCFDHGRMNIFESALIYYKQLENEFPDSQFAEMGRKNRERIEAIYSQKGLEEIGHKVAVENMKKQSKKSLTDKH